MKDNHAEQAVRNICSKARLDSVYVKSGYSMLGNFKYKLAKVKYGIPDGEDTFLICDVSTWQTCKTGFAACSKGIYYSTDGKQKFFINWNDFRNTWIQKMDSEVLIGAVPFNAKRDADALYGLLIEIQKNI